MNITTQPLFQQKFFSFSLENHEHYKKMINQIILVEENKHLQTLSRGDSLVLDTQSNVYAWRTNWNIHLEFPILHQICQDILQYGKEIIKQEKIECEGGLRINNCWINKYKKDDYALSHAHDRHGWSCVYFVQIPDDSSTFQFHNPIGTTFKSALKDYAPTLDISVTEGSVLFFQGVLFHSVTPHQSSQERITLAGNLCNDFKEK